VDDGVEALDVFDFHVPHVPDQLGDRGQFTVEGAGAEQITVQAGDLVIAFEQKRNQDTPYVSPVTRYQNFHFSIPSVF